MLAAPCLCLPHGKLLTGAYICICGVCIIKDNYIIYVSLDHVFLSMSMQ